MKFTKLTVLVADEGSNYRIVLKNGKTKTIKKNEIIHKENELSWLTWATIERKPETKKYYDKGTWEYKVSVWIKCIELRNRDIKYRKRGRITGVRTVIPQDWGRAIKLMLHSQSAARHTITRSKWDTWALSISNNINKRHEEKREKRKITGENQGQRPVRVAEKTKSQMLLQWDSIRAF